MKCNICSNSEGVHICNVNRTYRKGEELLVIENVPIISCPHCGESYMTAETLHKIEQVKLKCKIFAVARFVDVVSLNEDNAAISLEIIKSEASFLSAKFKEALVNI
jgi:YgiT-type zinc finger domain-containing protein